MHSILKINAALFARLFLNYRQLSVGQQIDVEAACATAVCSESTSDDRHEAEEKLVELLMQP